tara:strand:+ start:405 stop:533 length:129 start_codon:yes stop_codon:yes gene_type:complete
MTIIGRILQLSLRVDTGKLEKMGLFGEVLGIWASERALIDIV